MTPATIDACSLIDLLASGHAEAVLRANGNAWRLPVAVRDEVRFVRKPDPADPRKLTLEPVDLTPLVSAGVLALCQPDVEAEIDLFVQYAALFRSDGEAMCLALAEARGWSIVTDDRKAIRIGREAGLNVLSSPQLLRTWAEKKNPDPATVAKALKDIERFAQFRPNPTMQDSQWWLDGLAAE